MGCFFKPNAMKKIFVLLFSIAGLLVNAQDSTQTKPQFKFGINYNSNLNYYGRTDSLKSTGVFPLAELWVTPKLYINVAPVFVNNTFQSFDYAGTVTTVGYQNLTEKWLTSIYALKPFYKANSQFVQSALKAQTGINISRINKIVNINLGGDVKFSDKIDFGATAGLDHIIKIENSIGSVWVI